MTEKFTLELDKIELEYLHSALLDRMEWSKVEEEKRVLGRIIERVEDNQQDAYFASRRQKIEEGLIPDPAQPLDDYRCGPKE